MNFNLLVVSFVASENFEFFKVRSMDIVAGYNTGKAPQQGRKFSTYKQVSYIRGGYRGEGGQRALLTPLQKFLVYQDRDTLIEQSQ